MRRVLYGGGSFVTGDAIASTLLDYARVLASRGSADTIQVPALVDGVVGTVEVLVGPASQLMTEPVADADELEDSAFLDEVDGRIRTHQQGTIPSTPPVASADTRFFDDL